MAVRDRVVLWVLGGGIAAAAVVWSATGPLPALVVGVLAVLAACAAYRVEPPRIGLGGTPWPDEEEEGAAAERGAPVDQ